MWKDCAWEMYFLSIQEGVFTYHLLNHISITANYRAQTWHFWNKSLAEKLEKVNERAIRFVLRDKHTTYQGRI